MVQLTLIARVTDGLPLAEGLDSDKSHNLDEYKAKAKVCLLHSLGCISDWLWWKPVRHGSLGLDVI